MLVNVYQLQYDGQSRLTQYELLAKVNLDLPFPEHWSMYIDTYDFRQSTLSDTLLRTLYIVRKLCATLYYLIHVYSFELSIVNKVAMQ